MREVHLVSRPATGGIVTHLAGLLEDLPGTGWVPILHAPLSVFAALSTARSIERVCALDIRATLTAADLPTAAELARQLAPDSVVHAHGIRAAWICLLAQSFRKMRLIVTLHNVPPHGLVSRIVLRAIAAHSARVVCVSQFIADKVSSGGTSIIPNGVKILPLRAQRRGDLVSGWTNEEFTVLCAARLAPEKGVDLLLDAARTLPDYRFLIAGDGPLRGSLQAAAPSNALFLGHRRDVDALMAAVDLVAIPSRSEGQGIAALEAFAAGTPVAAAAVGGLVETIVDGETGILFDPGSAQSLATAITALRQNDDQRNVLAAAGQKWVRMHRDRTRQSGTIANLYNEVAA